MSLTVLTAVADSRWEAELVAAFDGDRHGMSVVRRCVDLADLLATAASGIARVALVSADLRRLDRDSLARLSAAGVAAVGVTAPGDEAADRRLRKLGVTVVLPADTGSEQIARAVSDTVAAFDTAASGTAGYADPRAPLRGTGGAGQRAHAADPSTAPDPGGVSTDGSGDGVEQGRVVAVWGPTGGPGRSTVAAGLAAEAAALGSSTLLVDADSYGGAIGQLLGLLDESPGLAAACRAAGSGALDAPALTRLARQVGPRLRVLTGLSRAERWPELRPAALDAVLSLARGLAETTIVDCGFCLEQDEELAFDTTAPRRNGATLTALDAADEVVVVGAAEPVGLARLVRALGELRDAHPQLSPTVVVNRVRPGCVGPGDPHREIAAALDRYAGVRGLVLLPQDTAGCDAAVNAGQLLAEAAPRSPMREPLRQLAARLAGVPAPRAARHRLARPRRLRPRARPLASGT
jgi:MinD-like ATPase involved in chromosome partitioning or flagellar assembly